MSENHVRNRDPEQHALSEHRAAGKGLKRIDGAQMALAKKNTIIAKFFGTARAPVNFIDTLNAAMEAM